MLNSKSLKWISLVVLIGQTTALVLMLRYSRTQQRGKNEPRYLSSTAVVNAEIFKFFTCILVLLWNHTTYAVPGWSWHRFRQELDLEIVKNWADTLKVGVPALLYVIQNNLLFYALSKLDAATYQVTYQLKILATAFFSVTMLNKPLDCLKWTALLLLTTGVALVQLPRDSGPETATDGPAHSTHGHHAHKASPAELASSSDRFMGLMAVIAACCSSGFAGVYFEKILKTSAVSLWMRNLQLAFFSVFGGLFMTALYDWAAVEKNGFLQGYDWTIWVVVLLQAYGGLVIALVVKYADNILKGFAASLSILLSSLVSWWLLGDFEPSLVFALGAITVILSSVLYGYEPPKTPLEQYHDA